LTVFARWRWLPGPAPPSEPIILAVLSEWRVEPGAGGWGTLGKPGGIALARGGRGLLAWGYTDGLGNLDVDVVGATDLIR
jgi:hypothetical protein